MNADTPSSEADRSNRHHVVSADALTEGERVIVDIQGREVAVFYSNGEYHAVSNYCPHQGGPACEGLLSGTLEVDDDDDLIWSREDEIVACPWHGWEFDITDGSHTASDKYRLPIYEASVEDGEIYVKL